MADSDRYPYVQDLDRRWHKRPILTDWWPGDTQCLTMCGRHVASVHVSAYDPRLERTRADRYCRCLGRLPK